MQRSKHINGLEMAFPNSQYSPRYVISRCRKQFSFITRLFLTKRDNPLRQAKLQFEGNNALRLQKQHGESVPFCVGSLFARQKFIVCRRKTIHSSFRWFLGQFIVGERRHITTDKESCDNAQHKFVEPLTLWYVSYCVIAGSAGTCF